MWASSRSPSSLLSAILLNHIRLYTSRGSSMDDTTASTTCRRSFRLAVLACGTNMVTHTAFTADRPKSPMTAIVSGNDVLNYIVAVIDLPLSTMMAFASGTDMVNYIVVMVCPQQSAPGARGVTMSAVVCSVDATIIFVTPAQN